MVPVFLFCNILIELFCKCILLNFNKNNILMEDNTLRKGVNHTDVKNTNRGIILQLIASGKDYSRAAIASKIHLSKMTVTNIVNELIEEHYVCESQIEENTNIGRNPVQLDIAPDAPKVIGIYLSRDAVHCILTEITGKILYHQFTSLCEETANTLTQKIIKLIQDASAVTADTILGIGVSSIGPLDAEKGVILKPTNFFHISDYSIKAILEDCFQMPVFVNNDMNASALAEKLFGMCIDTKNFVYLGISNGIGSGIISDGKLFQNKSGFVGEIGHMGIYYEGALCSCGRRGCLEAYINMPVILEKLQLASNDPSLTFSDFISVSKQEACHEIFQDMAEKLSYAIINTCNMMDPQIIILGHEGYYLPDRYVSYIQQEVNAKILAASHKYISIRKSSFGMKTPVIGSACCLLNEFFAGHFFTSNHSKGSR